MGSKRIYHISILFAMAMIGLWLAKQPAYAAESTASAAENTAVVQTSEITTSTTSETASDTTSESTSTVSTTSDTSTANTTTESTSSASESSDTSTSDTTSGSNDSTSESNETSSTSTTEEDETVTASVSAKKAAVSTTSATSTAIYLNGSNGNDSYDGSTSDNAVKTFSRAKELAAALAAETGETVTIYITGTVNISGDITLSGIDAIVKRDPSFNGYLMKVNSGATATLSSITIDGNSEEVTTVVKSSLIYCFYGTLNIQDGTVLQNNVITSTGSFKSLGGAVYVFGGTLNMTGGSITNNTANLGGGVFVGAGVMNMSGGVISSNHAVDNYFTINSTEYRFPASGGGICVYDNRSVVNISDHAQIINNTSEDMGGGISVGIYLRSSYSETLNMTGGTVSGNSAGSAGGGIFIQGGNENAIGTANISGGTISNNSMTGTGLGNDSFGGGGIYVNGTSNGYSGVLNLTNALITDNTAALEGGGYAACPISVTNIYVKDGAAIYGNTASSAEEIYILASNDYGLHSGDPTYFISPTMLGGTSYVWKYSDGTEVPLNELVGTLSADANEELSIYTDVTSDANAEALATVFIYGNTSATRGGGIGSNGTVNIGTATDLTELNVDKVWVNDESTDRPDSIEVELYQSVEGSDEDPVYIGYETMTADSSGEWSLTFENLPASDSNGTAYVYTVAERSVDGYASTVSGSQEDGFTITNTKVLSITVKKVWSGGTGTQAVVHLYADGEEIASYVLNEANDWQYTFTNLAITNDDGNAIVYTISEDSVDGYESSISGSQEDGFTVTNTKITTSSDSEKNTSKTSTESDGNTVETTAAMRTEENQAKTPATGFSSKAGLYTIALLASVIGVICIVLLKRKNA